ncbi:hypothetical protein RchiOBHm_Chr5g0077211 [Rosa chinensis]|uniref:Uncharacterized protein n=1 Tax=Rosa chinensis TaxID=74649 RepID=A0A2P6QLX4_ROSCH|nr:hypothetical protein RchiOBHm_Chr5g0077211 [Rosa chinensis]
MKTTYCCCCLFGLCYKTTQFVVSLLAIYFAGHLDPSFREFPLFRSRWWWGFFLLSWFLMPLHLRSSSLLLVRWRCNGILYRFPIILPCNEIDDGVIGLHICARHEVIIAIQGCLLFLESDCTDCMHTRNPTKCHLLHVQIWRPKSTACLLPPSLVPVI